MRRAWDFIRLFGALALVFLMMVWPGEALSAAQGAMRAWAQSVGPSLFPFLALLPALTCQEAQCFYKRLLGRLMRPLFRLPGNAAAALFVGLLAGSPAGALAVERVSGGMRRGEVKRLGLMCAGVSPVYFISGVGAALFGSVELGLWLAAAQAAAQIMLGLALRGRFATETQLLPQAPDREGQHSVRAAVASVLQVCGYMALFSVGAAMVAKLAGGMAGDYLLYIADMPSGLARAAERGASWPLAAAVAGFGGYASLRRIWPCWERWVCVGGNTWRREVLWLAFARSPSACAFRCPAQRLRPWRLSKRERWKPPRWAPCCC